jgi:hypothetical protein
MIKHKLPHMYTIISKGYVCRGKYAERAYALGKIGEDMGQDKVIGGDKKEAQHFPHALSIACPHATMIFKISKLMVLLT